MNMVRHLNQHAERLPVPQTVPVNPVPVTGPEGKYFDKAVNLAFSSTAHRPERRMHEKEVHLQVNREDGIAESCDCKPTVGSVITMNLKCSYCPYHTSDRANIVKHQSRNHPNKAADVFYCYYKEGTVPDEMDNTPRWQKQQQDRNIQDQPKTELEPDFTPVQPPPEPMAIDLNLANIKTKDEICLLRNFARCMANSVSPMSVTPLFKSVSEATREAMQSHLLEELDCGRRGIMEPTELPVNQNIEKWVLELLNHQSSAIEKTKANLLAHSTNNVVEEPVPGPSGVVVAPSVNTFMAQDALASLKLRVAERLGSECVKSVWDFTESDLEEEFGVFGASKDDCYCCPKCDANFNSEEDIRKHLENELSKIRWRCTKCTDMFSLFHEAQFHDKSHPGPSARPIEAVRDPAVRAAWVNSLVNKQKKSIKRAVEEASPLQDFINLPGMSDNSLLVATHERPASADNLRGHPSQRVSRKRPANSKSNDRVIYGQASKKISGRKCPHCNFVSRSTHYKKSLKEHILRHFRLGVASCLYCDLSSSREVMRHHMENNHSDRPIRWKQTEIPNCLPSLIKIRTRKVVNKKTTVCLHCEKSIPLKYKNTHKHGNKASVFKQKGDVVAKCCICLTLCPDIGAMHEHFKNFHNDNVKVNMANYKLQVDKRELHSCGICQERFTFVRDLYLHHTDRHASKKLTYTTVPFRHDEDDHETRKRKLEEAGPAEMPVAKKSTSLNSFSNSIGIQDDVIIVIDSDSEIE